MQEVFFDQVSTGLTLTVKRAVKKMRSQVDLLHMDILSNEIRGRGRQSGEDRKGGFCRFVLILEEGTGSGQNQAMTGDM